MHCRFHGGGHAAACEGLQADGEALQLLWFGDQLCRTVHGTSLNSGLYQQAGKAILCLKAAGLL